jgi:Uma2 family endonuclease
MGVAQKYIPHYTYDDWLYWEGRWELIEGIPVAMSPAPLPEHQRVTAELMAEFVVALRQSKCMQCKVYNFIDYKIADDTILEPDVLVVCGNITKNYLDFPPALVIEVLSKSTLDKDRGVKFDLYEKQGVKYYLIVDTRSKSIEVYELQNSKYQQHDYNSDFMFSLDDDCLIAPQLNNVWQAP